MADRTQRVIWTALPNGWTEDGQVRLTVLASPRLVSLVAATEPLHNWPDFRSWATKMQNAVFTAQFGGNDAEAQRVSEPDQAVWDRLFGKTFVINHAFEDRRGTRILSYPVSRIHDYVENVYADIGIAAGDELPEKRDVLREISELARSQEDDLTLQRTVIASLDPKDGRQNFQGVQGAFTLQEVYNMPMAAQDPAAGRYVSTGKDDPRTNAQWRQHKFETLPTAADFQNQIDFHAIVSALNQYPRLLRLTGLAVDLTVDPGAFAGGAVTDPLSVKVDWSPQNDADLQTLDDGLPQTITRLETDRFEAVPRSQGGPLSNGYLNIDNERFRLIQMDVDGAGVKLRNTARSFLRAPANDTEEDPDRAGTPALRTAGLQLVEIDKHLSLDDAFQRSGAMEDALNMGNPIELFAEDIVRGYHADILDVSAAKPWASLCRRDSSYEFIQDGETMEVEDEEGMIRLGAQEAADPNDAQFQDLVKIGELVFAWSGWSLTAPRPGLALSNADNDQPDQAESSAPPGLPLESSFRVRRGSLPALRYGHEYRARVRVADLAGNSLPLEEGDGTIHPEASPPTTFRRYEPVPPPSNALVDGTNGLERPDDGESMARMAIRSFNVDPADNTVPTSAEIRRHVVPPRTSHVMAEQHGVLDAAPGVPDPTLYNMLGVRDQNLGFVSVLHEDPLTASSDLVDYSVGPEALATPYLPDVLAQTAMVRIDFDPKEGPTERVAVPYYPTGTWPEAQPFKIRIFEDVSASIAFDPATRTINIPLAKAEMMRVRISHIMEDRSLDLMALWHAMMGRGGLTPAMEAALEERAKLGDHWMLTPWLEMELVHAVQKPLVMPDFLEIGANRSLGETAATINYRSPIHAKSTAKVELRGRWREPYDIPSQGKPLTLNQSGTAFETRLDRDSFPTGEMRVTGEHAFGDTRFRRLAYRMEAPTRFPEFMPPTIRAQPDEMRITSDPGVALVPNTAPPPPPEIVEVTPTFGWTRTTIGNRTSSFRSGGGLRVWLKRPWFATGFGEMLGVIVARQGETKATITGRYVKFLTQWGVDPIWRSGTIASASPPVSAFPLRVMGGPLPAHRSPDFVHAEELELLPTFPRVTNLPLPESGGAVVDVVPHPVGYDPDRDQYYCDIQVSPGSSYYPFIRLALARFHPISAPSAHLSTVALADYMQIAPDRLLVMTQGSRASERKLQLFGHGYTRSPFKEERPRSSGAPVITVEIQTKDPDLNDDLAWSRRQSNVVEVPGAAVDFTAAEAQFLVSEADDLLALTPAEQPTFELVRPSLEGFLNLQPPLLWETTITVPRRKRGEELRVMVTEYERHMVDSDWDGREDSTRNPGLRLVYAEALTL